MVDQVKRAGSRDKANDLATALVVLLYQRQNSEGGTCRGDRGMNQSGVEGKSRGAVCGSLPWRRALESGETLYPFPHV